MKGIQIETAQHILLDFAPANLGERILATLIDAAVQLVYFITVVAIVSGIGKSGFSWPEIVAILPVVAYHLAMEVFFDGQSLGKKALHIRVVSLDGERATLGQYLIRWLFRVIDLALTEGLCAVFAVAFSKKSQRLGDMVAGTAVIKQKQAADLAGTLYMPPLREHYQARYPEAERLGRRDVALIREVMDYALSSGNLEVVHETAEKIASVLGIPLEGDPAAFLEKILEDYHELSARTS